MSIRLPRNNVFISMMIGLGLIGLVALVLASKAVAWHGDCYQDSHGTWWQKTTSDTTGAQYIDGGWWVVSTPQCTPAETPPVIETPAPIPAPTTTPTPAPVPVVTPTPKPKRVCVRVVANGTIKVTGPKRVHYRTAMTDHVVIHNNGRFVTKVDVQLRPENGRLDFQDGHRGMKVRHFILKPGARITFAVHLVPTARAYLKNVTLIAVGKFTAVAPHGKRACFSQPDIDRKSWTTFEP
jgi:hypothetical protein